MNAFEMLILGFSIALAILGIGIIMAVGELTLISLPLYIFILVFIGIALGIVSRHLLMRLFRGRLPLWVVLSWFVVLFVAVVGGLGLAVNALFGDQSDFTDYEVIIERKIVKTRQETRRTGRRTYTTGREYHVYYLEIKLPDGRKRVIHPDYTLYKKGMKGDTAYLRIGRGALGMQICDEGSFRLKHPAKEKKKFRNRRRKVDESAYNVNNYCFDCR